MSHELYENDGGVMTAEQMRERNRGLVALACEELRARIAELAAERDAAIDARLTAEATSAVRDRQRAENDHARANIQEAFVLQRAAWHLEHGCDTPERAAAEARRELAVVLARGAA